MNQTSTARQAEAGTLDRCVAASLSGRAAGNRREANVFELAGSVVRTSFPERAAGLRAAAKGYFDQHADAPLDPALVVRLRWIVDLPRLKHMLEARLRTETGRW